MNTRILTFAAAVPTLLTLAATPTLARFDAAVVPAEAQWVLYADLNTLRASALGTELMAMVPKVDLDSKELPLKVNLPKLLESIGSATAYGTNFSEDPEKMDGAIVVRGTEDLRKIVQAFLLAGAADDSGKSELEITEIKDLGIEAYQVEKELVVALPPGDAILVGKSRESLAAARGLLASDKGSMARAKNAVLAPLIPKSAQTYLLAASVVPQGHGMLDGNGPETRILQMARAASVAVGEDGAMTTARIQIDATSADMADKLVKILQGAVAMLSFAETDDEALAAFLRSVTVEKTESGALLNLAYPTDRLVQMIKTLQEEQMAEQSGRRNARGPDKPAAVQGQVVAEWTADKDLASDRPDPENIVTHTVENVALAPGQTIWLNSNRHDGENGRFDYLDIAPAGKAAASVRYEAENMRLEHAEIEEAAFASGGELIILTEGSGSARFVFHGAAGAYTLTAAYVDEKDGHGAFSISISDPKPQPGPEAPRP
ncbi:MAG: hypothetical protein IAE82_19580 [Opitutaceae bacterium]|nr:hypothetical protein [Opitutaceae bacterium]